MKTNSFNTIIMDESVFISENELHENTLGGLTIKKRHLRNGNECIEWTTYYENGKSFGCNIPLTSSINEMLDIKSTE